MEENYKITREQIKKFLILTIHLHELEDRLAEAIKSGDIEKIKFIQQYLIGARMCIRTIIYEIGL